MRGKQQETTMPEDGNDQSRLRIGGWLPGNGQLGAGPTGPATDRPVTGSQPYQPARLLRRTTPWPPLTTLVRPLPARHTTIYADAGVTNGPDLATGTPVAGQLSAGHAPPGIAADLGALAGRADPRRTLLLGGVALLVITTLVGVMALRDGSQEPIRGEFVAGVPQPDGLAGGPVNGDSPPGLDGTGSDTGRDGPPPHGPSGAPGVMPGLSPQAVPGLSPQPASTGAGTGGSGSAYPGTAPPNPATNAPPPATSTPAAPSPAPTAPARPALLPGARIGLEVASLPGQRVRHANFQAHVAPVDAASSTGTKADAAFIVRSGLASGSCVSFESVNFPGHYLRHSEFRVFLHRADGSALFRADATFCPVTGLGGTHTSLQSYNYPSRYLRHDTHKQMRVSLIGDGASSSSATFVVRPAL
ncbi:AbfB domain-containing protein [Micromonospora zingiberis]|nr:AbfB domain-containing protein [Micromonospora zingiberis]